jgi:hypothetical protein
VQGLREALKDWPASADEALLDLLRGSPSRLDDASVAALLERAERHGIAGVVAERLRLLGVVLAPDVALRSEAFSLARSADHQAHLDMIGRVDSAMASRGLAAVALKGAVLAERLYDRPHDRATSDIDLLVAEADLDAAARALRDVGYEARCAPSEARFRREHHHLHFHNPHAPPLELHFHAYRGFGSTLRAEPLLARRQRVRGFRAVGSLAPGDELLYLAVHAASHRFVRLGWLYDLALLAPRLDAAACEHADAAAQASGFERPLAFALVLLEELLGVRLPSRARAALGGRSRVLRRIVGEPSRPAARSATRFAYTVLLCPSWRAARAYATTAAAGHLRRLVRAEP